MQIIILLLIGGVCFFLISTLATLIVQATIDGLPISNMHAMAKHYPIPFMLVFFMPFQLGFLLIPSLIYYYILHPTPLKITKQLNDKGALNLVWSIALFISVFFALPFFTTINEGIIQFLGVYEELMAQKTQSDQQLINLFGPESSTEAFWLAIVLVAVLTGFAEEYFFRGFLFKHMLHHTQKKGLSVLVSGLVFALLHFNYVQFLPLVVFGITLALMYYVSGSLLPGILAHIGNNALNVYWVHNDNFPAWMETMYLEITIPSTLVLMGLVYYKRSIFS